MGDAGNNAIDTNNQYKFNICSTNTNMFFLATAMFLVGCLLGPCTSCSCPDCGPPMCGSDDGGQTFKSYKNTCHVGCEKAVVYCEGPCPCKEHELEPEQECPVPDCICPTVYQPVCAQIVGKPRKTYSNECGMRCDCARILFDGPCFIL